MLAFVIAPFFIALLVFVYRRTLLHLKIYKIEELKLVGYLFGLILFGGFVCIILGFLLPKEFFLKRVLTQGGFYWLGFVLYFFISLFICLVVRSIIWIFRRNKGYDVMIARNITAAVIIVFTFSMSFYGIVNAHHLQVTNYEVTSNKESSLDELNVVLISDLHLGYNVGIHEMNNMVNKINEQKPDVVILAGDIFDNEYEAIENPEEIVEALKGINAKYGKFATYGNHDIEEKILVGFTFTWSSEAKEKVQADPRMNQFVKDAGFKFLYDSYELIEDSVYIYGRPDGEKINFGNKERIAAKDITNNLDKSKTIICVDHEPGELKDLAQAGVDIDLSGHTHNGQIWPGTLTINLLWDNAYGLKQINNMTSIVTSGVGLFGVNMRTGCYPEIVNLKIKFKK